MEAVRVDRLSKDFGGVEALREVSFSVAKGMKLAVLGPNGAGKTTLFNLLNGQLSPTRGSIYVYGQDVSALPIHKRAHLGIARSFQITTLFRSLSVLHNLLIALHGCKPSRFHMFRATSDFDDLTVKAESLLRFIGLQGKENLPVHALSHGEQRKMEIALSLASEPKLLLLDEPSAGLTVAESADIGALIRGLGQDITVLVVAHDMDLVFTFAQRIIVLHNGELIAEGTPEEIQSDSRVRAIYIGARKGAGDDKTG